MEEVLQRTERGEKTKAKIVTVVKYVLSAAVGFCLAGVGFENQIYPFGLAYLGGVRSGYLITAGLGVTAGAFALMNRALTLKYAGAVMLLFILKTVFQNKIKSEHRLWVYPVFTFMSLLISSLRVMLTQSVEAIDYILMFCDALIAGAGTCFSYRISLLIGNKARINGATGVDTAAVSLAGALLLAGLARFTVGNFCPARLLGFYAVMLICMYGKTGAGTVAGVCVGLVFGMEENMPHMVYALPLAGFLGEICRENGAAAVGVGFAVSDALALILKGNPDTAILSVAEGGIAAALFVLTPHRLKERMMYLLTPFCALEETDENRRHLTVLLNRRARAVKELGVTLGAVCKLSAGEDVPSPNGIPEDVRDDICITCQNYDFCWKYTLAQTQNSFRDALSRLLTDARLTTDSLPERLKTVCRDKTRLCEGFERYYCEYNARLVVRGQVSEAKSLAASRFCVVSGILEDTASQLLTPEKFDMGMTLTVKEVLDAFGLVYTSLSVAVNEDSRYIIEVILCRKMQTSETKAILQRLWEKTNLRFSMPLTEPYGEDSTLLLFCESTDLRADYYQLSHLSTGERYCGDSCESFYDGRGSFYCVLSDGMGTGSKAAIDSMMACSLTSKLLKAGLSVNAAVETVNAALMIKSARETLATLDILKINLYTGKTNLYKAGGAFSVLRKNKHTVIAEKSSLPLGIIQQAEFQQTETVLKAGDALIMLTDGAGHLTPAFFRDMFSLNRTAGAKFYCETVLAAAEQTEENAKTDDITVACVVLS